MKLTHPFLSERYNGTSKKFKSLYKYSHDEIFELLQLQILEVPESKYYSFLAWNEKKDRIISLLPNQRNQRTRKMLMLELKLRELAVEYITAIQNKNKIIIAPSLQIAKEKGFDNLDTRYTVLTNTKLYHGFTRDISHYIFIEGEEFCYPSLNEDYHKLKEQVLIRCNFYEKGKQ